MFNKCLYVYGVNFEMQFECQFAKGKHRCVSDLGLLLQLPFLAIQLVQHKVVEMAHLMSSSYS